MSNLELRKVAGLQIEFGSHNTLVEVGAFFFFSGNFFILQLPNSLILVLEIYILLNCAEIQ